MLAAILLAMRCAESLPDLAEWWKAHQPALHLLSPAELAAAVAEKDTRKRHLASRPPTWHPEDSAA